MGKSFKYLNSGIQECRPPFLPRLCSSLWKEAEIREVSPDPGDPSMLMPSPGAPPGSWHSSPAAAGVSILPSVLPARRQRRQIPARAWQETREAEQGWSCSSSSLHTLQPAGPKRGAACSAWVLWGEDGVWSPELLQHQSLGCLG